jgi:hypothetical protein
MPKSTSPGKKSKRPSRSGSARLYTLEVMLVSGPLSRTFAQQNPVVSRTIQLRGNQTLADLHRAIFEAFGRTQEQMYEFQLGRGPSDPEGKRYVLPGAMGMALEETRPPDGSVVDTRLEDLDLAVGRGFGYWFDFAADWWHRVEVKKIDGRQPRGQLPRVLRRVGADPPATTDAGGAEPTGPQAITGDTAADVSCLIGELHLRKGDYAKAVEAFTRAIEGKPTPDAYLGRARAFRALAAGDERKARELG